jgi:hypothetical protein
MESITPRDTSNDCHRLQPITIAITSERRTKGKVEKVLGWLGEYPETGLAKSPDPFNPIFAATIAHGNFIRR